MTSFASFEERGYTVQAFMPSGSTEPLVWTIRITRGEELIREATVPMSYEPRFGPDVGDVQALEAETGKILAELP
ncbi:MAG: hypothetical protein QOJ64_711 [Acidobacteriota bacterium]|jgi:hypothetical protein|nr:hypothetical protein [Acidobacteriota bacterium]